MKKLFVFIVALTGCSLMASQSEGSSFYFSELAGTADETSDYHLTPEDLDRIKKKYGNYNKFALENSIRLKNIIKKAEDKKIKREEEQAQRAAIDHAYQHSKGFLHRIFAPFRQRIEKPQIANSNPSCEEIFTAEYKVGKVIIGREITRYTKDGYVITPQMARKTKIFLATAATVTAAGVGAGAYYLYRRNAN